MLARGTSLKANVLKLRPRLHDLHMHKLFFISVLVLSTALNVVPQACGEEITVEQLKTRTLGWTIKSSLKAYLQKSDFPRLKQQKINEIKKMNTEAVAAQYADAWPFLKKCPALVTRYRLTQSMSKERILKVITGLSLQDCLEAVDSVPDEVLVKQFEQCFNRPENEDKSLKEQINSLMDNWLPKS